MKTYMSMSMRQKKSHFVMLPLLTCLTFCLVLAFTLIAMPLYGCQGNDEAQITQKVSDAIAAFKNGNEGAQNELISQDENPFLGFGVSDKDATTALLKHFSSSIEGVSIDEGAQTAQVVVHASNVSIKAIMEAATQKTMDDAITLSVTPDNKEEIAKSLSQEVLDAAASDDADIISADITVNVKNENGAWVFVDAHEILEVLFVGESI